VTLKTFLSAGHCILFKVWGCWMHDYKGCTKYHIWLKCTPSVTCTPSLYSILSYCSTN
jgi:hypothetical protein